MVNKVLTFGFRLPSFHLGGKGGRSIETGNGGNSSAGLGPAGAGLGVGTGLCGGGAGAAGGAPGIGDGPGAGAAGGCGGAAAAPAAVPAGWVLIGGRVGGAADGRNERESGDADVVGPAQLRADSPPVSVTSAGAGPCAGPVPAAAGPELATGRTVPAPGVAWERNGCVEDGTCGGIGVGAGPSGPTGAGIAGMFSGSSALGGGFGVVSSGFAGAS